MKNNVLIKGGTVLSLDRSVGNLVGADVLIENGLISEVGTNLRSRSATVVDAADTIVMPGFVDAHRHLWQSLNRNLGSTTGPTTADHYTPDDMYAATLVGLLGALEGGITTVVDWCDVAARPGHLEAVLSAHADSGARTVLVPDVGDKPPSHETDANTTVAFGSPDITHPNLEMVVAHWAQARQAGRRIHARAGTDSASTGAVAELGRQGLLGADVTLSQCTLLDDADFDAIASSSTAVVLTPSSDMAIGLGAPPMQQLIDRGIRPGLGVGDERLAPGDAFAQMRAAISVQHATLFEAKLAGKGGVPNLLNTRDVLRYATVDGAGAAGLGDIAGTLTPGRSADVIVLRTDAPNIAPVNDAIGAVVWGMDTSNIDWVFVAGSAQVEHGVLTADTSRARGLVVAAQRRIAQAAKDPADAGATP